MSVIYGFVLVFYTFLIRVRFIVDVAASDYGHTITTQRSVGESIWRIVKAIFGMDSSVSSDSSDCRLNEVATTSQSEKRTLAKTVLRTEMVCIATSLAIELLQKITTLGMFDINDLLANSIGSCIGIGMVWL